MKRICVVCGDHPAAVMGGAQYQAAAVAEALGDGGEREVYYLARGIDPQFRTSAYRVVKVGRNGIIARRTLAADAPSLLRTLRRIDPHVIYERVLHAYTGICALYARVNRRCRFVYHVSADLDIAPVNGHPVRIASWADRKLGRFGLRRADAIIAQSERQSRRLEDFFGRKADLIVRNFHPSPQDPIQKPASPVRILWIGNLKPVKRPELFVELAEELATTEGIELAMIGRMPRNGRYEDLKRRIDACPNLNAPGELSQEAVNGQLAQSHILVNTSVAEGFPNTYIQAWMRAVPVVALGVDPDGVMTNLKMGYNAADFEALRKHVVTLAHESDTRTKMGENARRYALQHHSEKNVERIVELLDDLSGSVVLHRSQCAP